MTQSENEKLCVEERKRKAELGKLKNSASAGKLVSPRTLSYTVGC